MFVESMLVSCGALPADSDRYAYEVKWDGYRALIEARPRDRGLQQASGLGGQATCLMETIFEPVSS
jgi:hypothetical protein